MPNPDQQERGKELFAAFLRVGNPEVERLALRYHDYWKKRLDASEQEVKRLREALRETREALVNEAGENSFKWKGTLHRSRAALEEVYARTHHG